MTESDPNRHWDGQRWLAWNGAEWAPERSSPSAELPPKAEAVADGESGVIVDPEAEPDDETPTGRKDIDNAVKRMGRTLGIKRELRNLESKLDPGEVIYELARVERQGHGCLVAVTSHRLLFLREGMIRASIEEIPVRALTSVASKKRLVNAQLIVTVAGNAEIWPMTSAAHAVVVSEAIRRLMREAHSSGTQLAPAPAQPTPGATGPAPDHMESLRQLGALRDAGILTSEEFEAKKAEILARI
jgi:hypothetical protein